MNDWFTIERIDEDTYSISEYCHWEETHAYLLSGTEYSLIIDTGLGIMNIYEEVTKLTDKPVIAVATHIHWDHIGGHKYFPNFYVHRDEVNWLSGEFPLSLEQIKGYVIERCELPASFNIADYEFFQGNATRILEDNDVIDIGGRSIQVLHTPGHSPGHMCFYEKSRGIFLLVTWFTKTPYLPTIHPLTRRHTLLHLKKFQNFLSSVYFPHITL